MLLLINCYCIEFEVEIVCRYLEVEVYFFCIVQILVNFYVQNLGFLGFRGILLCFKRDYGCVYFYIDLICFRWRCLNYYKIKENI